MRDTCTVKNLTFTIYDGPTYNLQESVVYTVHLQVWMRDTSARGRRRKGDFKVQVTSQPLALKRRSLCTAAFAKGGNTHLCENFNATLLSDYPSSDIF